MRRPENGQYASLSESSKRCGGEAEPGSTADGSGLMDLQKTRVCRASRDTFAIRNAFRDYFISDYGRVSWQ